MFIFAVDVEKQRAGVQKPLPGEFVFNLFRTQHFEFYSLVNTLTLVLRFTYISRKICKYYDVSF